jgi:type I restriction enzyme S subunit
LREVWEQKRIGDILTLEYGKPLPPTSRSPSGRYAVYGANGIKDHSDKFYVDKPSIIVGRKGSAGEVTLTDDKCWPLDVAYFVTFDTLRYDLRFLYHLLSMQELTKLAKGVKPGINRNEVYSRVVRVPPLVEQQRIVAILNETFAGLTIAITNVERNLEKARELFESYLGSVFAQGGKGWGKATLAEVAAQFGRGKSKHRPRNDPSLYGGKYPFIQTGDIRNSDHMIVEYLQTYNNKGLAQSKLWPKGTICITIAANIAETGVLGFDSCFPDSVIGMVVNPAKADSKFVEYLLQSFKSSLQAEGKGSAQANINLATFEKREFPMPPVGIQVAIAERLDAIANQIRQLERLYKLKLEAISELKQSILQKAFSGELASDYQSTNVVPLRKTETNMKTASFAASILAVAYERHRIAGRDNTFGHKKAQKLLHLVEAVVGVEMGRDPIKDAAGPNDFNHMLRSTDWAEERGFFRFNKSDKRYIFERLENYKKGLEAARHEIENPSADIHKVIDFLLPMNSEEAEVLATVFAAWNNLIIKSRPVDDEAIVREAREDWHPEKMNIPRHKFFEAIALLRKSQVIPTGHAKLVREKYLL